MSSADILTTLVLCGLLGAVGQGIRAAVGLKSVATLQAQAGSQQDQFDAAYFALTMMIGFIAGTLAGIVLLMNGVPADKINLNSLLAVIAAGYAGTDFIENTFTNLMPKMATPPSLAGASGSTDQATKQPTKNTSTDQNGVNVQGVAELSTKFEAMSAQVTDMHSTINTLIGAGDGGVQGTTYPSWALSRDANLARAKYWDFIVKGANDHGLPLAVILAIGSKESQWGLALKPPGPAGTGDFTARNPSKWGVAMPTDGKGWGRGLMQIDWYSNEFAKSGDWQDAQANILFGCNLLAQKIKKFTDAGKDEETALRCGVSSYNGMSGATSPYANDVMARAAWIHDKGLDSASPA